MIPGIKLSTQTKHTNTHTSAQMSRAMQKWLTAFEAIQEESPVGRKQRGRVSEPMSEWVSEQTERERGAHCVYIVCVCIYYFSKHIYGQHRCILWSLVPLSEWCCTALLHPPPHVTVGAPPPLYSSLYIYKYTGAQFVRCTECTVIVKLYIYIFIYWGFITQTLLHFPHSPPASNVMHRELLLTSSR